MKIFHFYVTTDIYSVGDTNHLNEHFDIAHDRLHKTLLAINQVHHLDLRLRPPQVDGAFNLIPILLQILSLARKIFMIYLTR